MRKHVIAGTLALSLLAGASTAVGAEASGRSTSAPQVSAESVQVPARGIVGLRRARRCTFEGTPMKCVIDVTRLRVSRDHERVVAIGTVTPRGVPGAPSIPFRAPVLGVDFPPGPLGEGGAQQFPTCDIVSLVLGPLHLDVLGLVIDLNRVVLNITGQTGPGELLGNLLCGLIGLLDGGVPLTRFLAVLTNLLQAINALLRL